jgi:L-iditol 2-dehydrogenase
VSAVSLDDMRDAVLEWSDGTGADVVVECVGRPEAWEAAQRLAATGGIVLLYGGCAAGTRVSFDAYRLHYEEVDLIGAFHYGRPDVRDAFALLRDGRVRIDPLVTHVRPLARLDDALALVLSREAIKVAIEP